MHLPPKSRVTISIFLNGTRKKLFSHPPSPDSQGAGILVVSFQGVGFDELIECVLESFAALDVQTEIQ